MIRVVVENAKRGVVVETEKRGVVVETEKRGVVVETEKMGNLQVTYTYHETTQWQMALIDAVPLYAHLEQRMKVKKQNDSISTNHQTTGLYSARPVV